MGSVNPSGMTKSGFWTPAAQPYITQHLSQSHDQVLYNLGEYAMFVMLWRPVDFDAGLVERCTRCFGRNSRIAAAYEATPDPKCPECYGTTFEGGYRAKVIRPAIVSDLNTETVEGRRGEHVQDTLTAETTSDIFLRKNDVIMRADGSRYRTDEMNTLVVRTGFDVPDQDQSVGGVIPAATLEDPTMPVYLIPPSPDEVQALLRGLTKGRHTPGDLTVYDDIAPNGYLVP